MTTIDTTASPSSARSTTATEHHGDGGTVWVAMASAVNAPGPSVLISSDAGNLRAGQTANITFTFSSAPVGFTAADVVVSGGAVSGLANQGNGIYTALFTPGPNVSGPASITVTGGSYTDGLGTQGSAGSTPSIMVDTIAPTVAISSDVAAVKVGETATITFTFSELPLGFAPGDITTVNGTLSGLAVTADAMVYTATFTPTAGLQNAMASITIASVAYADQAGNSGTAGPSPTIAIDTQAPTALPTTLAFSNESGMAGDRITNVAAQGFAGTLTGNLQAGEAVEVSLDNGATWVTAMSSVGSGNWSLAGQTLQGGAGRQVQVRVSDTAGNLSSTAGFAYTLDTTPPTVQVTSSKATLNSAETALIRFTFSEAPFNLSQGSVQAAGGALSVLTATANPLVYTAVFTPVAGVASGVGSISVTPGSYTDAAGNSGLGAATPNITYATVRPGVAVLSNVEALKAGESANITFKFSHAPVGFTFADIAFDGGILSGFVATGDPLVYTAIFTPDAGVQGLGTISIANASFTDGSANLGVGGSVTPISVDTLAPSVSITSSSAALNAGATAQITFTFSEAPAGFTRGVIAVTGGTLSDPVQTANPLVYTAVFTPAANVASATAQLSIAPGSYTDVAGNVGSTGSSTAISIDTVPPLATAIGMVQFTTDSGLPGDRITNEPQQTLSGSLSSQLAADEVVQLSLNNGSTWQDIPTSFGSTSWSSVQTLAGSSTLVVRVRDGSGNASTPSLTPYTIDTVSPTVAIASSVSGTLGTGQSTTLTFMLSEPVLFTLADIAITGGVLSDFSGSGTSYTAKLTPPANSTAPITVTVHGGLLTDVAGNGNPAATPLVLTVNTNPPATDGGAPVPAPTTIDGVPVTTTPGPNGATVVTIPVVLPTRPDAPGSTSPLADIPLVKAPDGHPIVSVSVPAGVGLSAEGLTTGTSGAAALAELGFRIERVTGATTELINSGNVFYATLAPNESLNVQIIKPTLGAGYDGSRPLVINGSSNPADGKQAVIIDARSLPSGTVIQVDNIEFVAVVGDVRIIGGAGQNMASGDGSTQWIVLGPGDDIIHGGGGNDTVGSEGGDDQVFGDAGDDTVFGGAGNDLLSGGTGSDKLNGGTGFDVAIQEGARTDYTVTLEGAGIKLTHTASGISDWLVDVEQVRFANGPGITVAHSAAEEAGAYLFQKWIGRDLTQSESAVIQTLAGQSAEQVATLFAQLFPIQASGKTPAQLLDGMAAAGAIRVDAVRDVIVSGDAGNNTITPVLGLARYVDGGVGIDTVILPATLAQTHLKANGNGAFTLQRLTDGAMLDLTHVERVTFNDTKLALDLSGNAGQAAKLLSALGGPALLANKGLVGEVIRALDGGATGSALAGQGLQALGANTPMQIAQTLWTNVVGRAGTGDELKIVTDIMAGGVSAGDLVVMAANLDMNATRIDLVGLAAKGVEFA